ncbi:MAG TPA: hypothetical protein VGL58_15815 [Caulobacteraceae bacterium]|jgi:hypothetical protein
MGHLSIRDLQKISGEAIQSLPGLTPIRSGDRTVGFLMPVRKANDDRLRAFAEKMEALARERNDPEGDDRILREAGADLTDWSLAATEKFMAEARAEARARAKARRKP